MSVPIDLRIKIHKELWVRGGPNYCFYCQEYLSRSKRTLDHLTPSSRGGNHHISNLVLACIECNRAKADMTLFEFHIFVTEHGGIERVKELFGKGSHSRKILVQNS